MAKNYFIITKFKKSIEKNIEISLEKISII